MAKNPKVKDFYSSLLKGNKKLKDGSSKKKEGAAEDAPQESQE